MLPRSIGTKFLIVVGFSVIVFSGFVLLRTWSRDNSHTRELLSKQTELALHFDLAIRQYVAEHVRPFAQEHIDEDEFVPETMSTSFVARSIFDTVREEFPDYIIKFSSDNPRNPANLAEPEELEMLRYFNENPKATEWAGQIELSGKKYEARFYARRMKESCLQCHGTPADAPESLLKRYGNEAGFHRQVGSVIALDTVAIPIEGYKSAALANTLTNSFVLIMGLCVFLGAIYWAFHLLVTRRLASIAGHFKNAFESGDDSLIAPIQYSGSDEISELAMSFNKMATDLQRTTTSIDNLNREVAERRRGEEALKWAKKQAEAASEAKSEFLANMSHEIRTPLNAIIGFSEVLACGDMTDEQTEWVRTIRDSGEHLLELINDILDFSKIEAGKLDVEIVECSLKRLCAKVESLMRSAAISKELEFGFTKNGALPAGIRTDPTRLSQCLVNLANNAIKFTERGHVRVNVSLQETDNGPYIRFDVEDTGIGIAPEKQKAIFESFTQADGSMTRSFGGSGLGLAITKRLAELLDGRLSLISEEGKGSVFSLMIPAGVDITKEPPLEEHELGDELIAEEGGATAELEAEVSFTGRVLVAEDTVTNQRLVKIMLERMGFEVTTVVDGAEAVRKGMAEAFDLIFMDIQMPKVNGYEATRELRREGLKTPIIALTANAMKGDDEKCIEAGCSDYLSKPIDGKSLAQTIRKYLSSEGNDMCEKIDLVRSAVDELGELCSQDRVQEAGSVDRAVSQESGEVLGWDQLINRIGDEDIVREVVPLCVVDNKERLEMLDKAVQAGNGKDVKLYAHAIKGSAANIGAERLSEVASGLEKMAYQGDLSQAEHFLQRIKAEFARLESFVSNPDWIESAKKQPAEKQPQ